MKRILYLLLAIAYILPIVLMVRIVTYEPPKPVQRTEEEAMRLFQENFELLDEAAQLIWEHHTELDLCGNEGEGHFRLYTPGAQDHAEILSRTSLTEQEKETIVKAFEVYSAQVTYYLIIPGTPTPEQAQVISIFPMGRDELDQMLVLQYIRDVPAKSQYEIDLYNYNIRNSSHPPDRVWTPLGAEYWYKLTYRKSTIVIPTVQ